MSDRCKEERLSVGPALEVLVALRTDDQIVVTQMGSAREWPKLSQHPLDFHYIPSTMGGAVPLGLGLALAQPDREVWVCQGDGSLQMTLGCLITVVASGVTNLSILLIDNGLYEVTGGQKTPSHVGETDFAGLARSAGFPNVAHFWDLDDWRRRAGAVLDARGPRFVWLEVEPVKEDHLLNPPCPMDQQLARLRSALSGPC